MHHCTSKLDKLQCDLAAHCDAQSGNLEAGFQSVAYLLNCISVVGSKHMCLGLQCFNY